MPPPTSPPFPAISDAEVAEVIADFEALLTDRVTISRAAHATLGTPPSRSVTYAAVAGGPFKAKILPSPGLLDKTLAGMVAADGGSILVEKRAVLTRGDRITSSTETGDLWQVGGVQAYRAPTGALLGYGGVLERRPEG